MLKIVDSEGKPVLTFDDDSEVPKELEDAEEDLESEESTDNTDSSKL